MLCCGWKELSSLSKQLSHTRLQGSTEFLKGLQKDFSEEGFQEVRNRFFLLSCMHP
jgi:hypothetical protein